MAFRVWDSPKSSCSDQRRKGGSGDYAPDPCCQPPDVRRCRTVADSAATIPRLPQVARRPVRKGMFDASLLGPRLCAGTVTTHLPAAAVHLCLGTVKCLWPPPM